MERRAVTFTGRVQGVGFRAVAREVARRFAVTGWVRNEPDGSVRMEVQGQPGEVERVLGALRERMKSNIKGAREEQMLPAPSEVGFEIRGW